jgi:tRNA (cmo5U34)-methyltransferase
MGNESKRFAKMSEDYELGTQCTPGYMELEDRLAEKVRGICNNIHLHYHYDPTIIDIGVGTGITTKFLLAYDTDVKIIGIDNEKKMIRQALVHSKILPHVNLKDYISRGKVKLIESDALEYLDKTKSESINVITSAYTLHNFTDNYRNKVQKEIFRVLIPGGMFINNDKYAVDDKEEYMNALVGQLSRYKLLGQSGRPDLELEYIKHELDDQNPNRIMKVRKSVAQLKEIGFKDIYIKTRIEQYAILSAQKPYE